MTTIGFIGAGNMGGALARAAVKGKNKVLLSDIDNIKLEAIANEIGASISTNEQICQTADYIFIGVKPQVIIGVMQGLKSALAGRGDAVLVSMAAGVTIEKLREISGGEVPIIRIMPNLPVACNKGEVLYTYGGDVSSEKANALVCAMSAAGRWDFIEEALIDAASAVSGCSPAFAFMYIAALAKGGAECGIEPDTALKYAAQATLGAAQMILDGGEPEVLRKAVCSPGGSTIEGVKALWNAELEKTIMDAVQASYKRTVELGK